MVQTMRGQSPKMLLARGGGGSCDKDYATFCSISLSSEPRGSRSLDGDVAALQQIRAHRSPQQLSTYQQHQRLAKRRQQQHERLVAGRRKRSRNGCCAALSACCDRAAHIPLFMVVVGLLFLLGVSGVAATIVFIVRASVSTDQVLFLGALVSCAFSLVVIVCYVKSAAVRSHPNPLIFSKSLVDVLLAALYIFQYCSTEYAATPVALPFRLAALTQALLVCGEFWFFAIPIDLVQSITNPFTSYAHNFRVYWVYSTLSGSVCGFLLWFLDDSADDACATAADDGATVKCRLRGKEDQRFFWFHHNTDMPGFFWHRWILYHVWVLVYLLFGVGCIRFVKRRLRRGLEETFDVRRRILTNGIWTCAIYISWSFTILGLFALTNLATTKHALASRAFATLVHVSAFFHAARGCVNVIVWFVVNAPSLTVLCAWSAAKTRMKQSAAAATTESFSSSDLSSASAPFAADQQEQRDELNPQLNRALRRQIVHMATSGIIESVEQYHVMNQRIQSNQTFELDWARSKQRDLLAMSSSESFGRAAAAKMRSATTPATTKRNSTVQVVEARAATPSRFALFLPLAMKEMQFYDFQPRVFASIRALYGIDDAEYMYAFRSTVNERISEGRSGAFVFHTCDRRYIVKSMTADEKAVLLELLPSYLRYLKWNPRTLLPRFLGFHAMKMYGQVFYVVVMGNILSTPEPIHRRYDIKGSWVDRNAPACVLGERYRCSKCNRFFTFGASTGAGAAAAGASAVGGEPCDAMGTDHYPDITLRDNDLKKRLKLEPETASKLLKQLTRDSNFLASMGIMDYSLLIGAHYSHFRITTRRRPDTQAATPDAQVAAPLELERNALAAGATTVAAGDRAFVHVLVDQPNRDGNADDDGSSEGEVEEVDETTAETSAVQPLLQAPSSTAARATGSAHSQSHCYRAHQVSGPSAYYFGLVDILQLWTLGKQTERAYKVHVLRKDARGVSAMAPKPYALRFQQKMHQLFSYSQAPPPAHHVVLERHDGERSGSLADLVV